MKLSVFYDHAVEASAQSGHPIADILKEFHEAGITAVEIEYHTLSQHLFEIGPLLSEAGMSISSIPYFHNFNWDPSIEEGKKVVDLAESLGCTRIMPIPGFLDEEDANELNAHSTSYEETDALMYVNDEVRNMVEALTALCGYAADKGVTVTLEDFDNANSPCSRMNELLYFVRHVPGLKITFDSGNFAFSHEDMLQAYEALRQEIVHVHMKDRGFTTGRHEIFNDRYLAPVAVGSGYLPLGELKNRLLSSGYEGYFVIEHYGAKSQREAALDSAEFLLHR